MPSVWTPLYLLMTTSLSAMLTQANPELDDISVTFSSTDITLGSPFAMRVIAEPLALMLVGVNVVYPNGTAGQALVAGTVFDLIPAMPNGTVPAEIVTSQFNANNASYCTRNMGFSGSAGYTPTVAGTYTVMPYVQYFFGANGYRYENDSAVCIDSPVTVETVPIANFTLNVNPGSDGQTTLTEIPTSIDLNIVPSSTSLASFVAEPTGEEFDNGFGSSSNGTGSNGGQPPSPSESTGGSDNTRTVGLPLTLSLCAMALGIIGI